MSLIRKSRSEKNDDTLPETIQREEVKLTPRQEVNARVSVLRSKGFSDASFGTLFLTGAVCQILGGEKTGVAAALEGFGVDRPVTTIVGLGCAAMLSGMGISYTRSAVEQTIEAQALKANLAVHDMAAAEQAEMLAMPQPELVWKNEQA